MRNPLLNIGADKYDSFITDGHSAYFGRDGDKVVSPHVDEKLSIAETSNRESFLKHLDRLEMSNGVADSGMKRGDYLKNFSKTGASTLESTS
jgi:hypothetical protein